ncbi:MAG: cyanate transporter [Sphingomonas bacterium]
MLSMVVLVGLNLRPFLTATGPLAAGIRADTGMTLQVAALLTLVPMGLMGVLAFAGPWVQGAVGDRRAVIGALLVMAAGSFARLFVASGAELIATAAVLGIGVAIVQAVFPAILKRSFPGQLTVVMGLYSATLMGGGAVGAQVSPLIAAAAGGWRAGLGWLVAPALAAALAVALVLPRGPTQAPVAAMRVGALLRRPRAWLLMGCFGLVNGGYSSIIAWLAPFYQERGWNAPASGGLLALMALSQGIAALLFPVLARHGRDRRGWLWTTLALQAAGFLGLAAAPDLAPSLWAVSVGAGLGASFALTMVTALDHLDDPAAAGALAALMQGGGFLVAASAPWIAALLHDRTGGFAAGWMMHLACIAIVSVLTVRLAPAGYERAIPI